MLNYWRVNIVREWHVELAVTTWGLGLMVEGMGPVHTRMPDPQEKSCIYSITLLPVKTLS